MQDTSERTQIDVKVILIGELGRLAGRREVLLRLPEGATTRSLARELGAACGPAFAERVLTPDGDLQSHVAVFVNGEQPRSARDGVTYVQSGDVELMLMPMFEGG